MTTQARVILTPRSFVGRAFQFTLHDLSQYEGLKNHLLELRSCDYMISCKEIAPTTGKEHIHIYAHFTKPYHLSQKIMNHHAHIEICQGTPQQNIEYIRKDGNILDEVGTEPHQGYHRTVKELRAVEDPSELDTHEYNTWLKIRNTPQKIKVSEWSKEVKVYYIQGPSGSGKSKRAEELMQKLGIESFEEVKHTNNFWNGVCDGCGCAVYDDFRDSHMTASEFINFIDYRVHNLNIKGGQMKNKYNTIIITSVQRIDEIYGNCYGEPREQWMRRIIPIDMSNINLSAAL